MRLLSLFPPRGYRQGALAQRVVSVQEAMAL